MESRKSIFQSLQLFSTENLNQKKLPYRRANHTNSLSKESPGVDEENSRSNNCFHTHK